jgi:hypothetical protein
MKMQETAGDACSETVHHAEDALHVLAFQFLGEQDLTGAGIVRANVEAKLRGSDLQQGAGNVGVGAGIARDLLGLGGIERLTIFAGTLHRAHHTLVRDDVETLYLGQVRGEHVGKTIVEPVEGLVLREIVEVEHGDGLVLQAARGAWISTSQEKESR